MKNDCSDKELSTSVLTDFSLGQSFTEEEINEGVQVQVTKITN